MRVCSLPLSPLCRPRVVPVWSVLVFGLCVFFPPPFFCASLRCDGFKSRMYDYLFQRQNTYAITASRIAETNNPLGFGWSGAHYSTTTTALCWSCLCGLAACDVCRPWSHATCAHTQNTHTHTCTPTLKHAHAFHHH